MALDTRQAAREIAEESKTDAVLRDKSGEITNPAAAYARNTVQLRVPIRDTAQLKHHLTILRNEIEGCLAELSLRGRDETTALLGISMRLRICNQKINAYRRIRSV